jgi:Tfp pilus assembly protein PilZ
MNRARVVIKRPLTHYVISLAYILAPLVNLLLLVVIARIALGDVVQRLFQGYGVLAGIWLLSAPIVGIGLYFVHQASWYIFLGHSGLILVDYVLKWVQRPDYYWRSITGVHQILLFTGNIALVVVIGYIIQKDFRAPYFQILPRGWRTGKRTLIRHFIELDGRRCNITDLSTGGCFVSEPALGLSVGAKVSIRFRADTMEVGCRGEVMRQVPAGYGVRFMGLPAAQKRDVRRMLRKRFPFRYPVHLAASWASGGRVLEVTMLDISDSGCYLEADVSGIGEGSEGALELLIRRRTERVPAQVVWVNAKALHGKPVGFGVRFRRAQRRLRRLIVSSLTGSASRRGG